MADCSGCPYLQQASGHATCAMRNGEALDEASYTKETCEHCQAYLQTAGQEAGEEPEKKADKKAKKKGSGGTGCLVALLVASVAMFIFVVVLIVLALFFGEAV